MEWAGRGDVVTVGGCNPAAPNHHNVAIASCDILDGITPRHDLLRPVGGRDNHGGANHVAIHRRNNNGHAGCHIVSFGHRGASVPTAIGALRCSPGHDTFVTLIRCASNIGDCVVTPSNLGINSIVLDNGNTSVGPNGYLPFRGVPINAVVRGVRLCPNHNTRLIHSTNGVTRLVTGRGNCTLIHLPSNRVHGIPLGYATIINRISGVSRRGIGLNGTNHGHRVNIHPNDHNAIVGPYSRPRNNNRNHTPINRSNPVAP